MAGSIIGYREWRSKDLWLSRIGPFSVGPEWNSDGTPTRASCRSDWSHHAPDPECECGLYAYHPWISSTDADLRWFHARAVYGFIEAWGRIEVHAQGFRAEYARPVAFIQPSPDGLGGDQKQIELYRPRLARLARECGAELIGPGEETSVEDWLEENPRQLTQDAVIRLVPRVRKHLPPSPARQAARRALEATGEVFMVIRELLLAVYAIALMLFIFWPIIMIVLYLLFGLDPLNRHDGKPDPR